MDQMRQRLDAMAARARADRQPGEDGHLVLAYLAGAMRYYSDDYADLLRQLADEMGEVSLARWLHRRPRTDQQQEEVIGRLMDVVHEEALQRNQWYNHEEEERLRDVAAAAHGG